MVNQIYTKKRVLFVYRNNSISKILTEENMASEPTEFLYGINFVDKDKFNIDFINYPKNKNSFYRTLFYPLEKVFSKITKLGLPLEIFPLYRKQIKKADIIFCVNDGLGLSMLFWKKIGFIKSEIIFIAQSIPERYKYFKHLPLIRPIISSLMYSAKTVLTLSDCVHAQLIKDFKINSNKIKTFYFGTDTDFWRPTGYTNKEEKVILSIGNDMNRDFQTLVKALPDNLKLKVITKRRVDTQGKNVKILTGISNEDLKEMYNSALFVVIPSIKLENESSGLSCALQAMSIGKVVIISRIPTLTEIFTDKKDCLFYNPEDSENLNQKIKMITENNELKKIIENNALETIKKFTNKQMGAQLTKYLS